MSQERFDELRRRLAEVSDLGKTMALLSWDQQVMMPPKGAELRAEQLATVGRIAHERFTAPEVGRLLEELSGWAERHDYDSLEASLVRVVSQDWDKARRVPSELRAALTREGALSHQVWVDARSRSDYTAFLPALRKNLDLVKRYVECFDVGEEPYDILLDDYERGMKTTEVRVIFDYLKAHQAPLVQEVAARNGADRSGPRTFPLELQRRFELEVVRRFGFDDACWRLDPTVHPFASGTGVGDIRITTRYAEHNLESLFATMHEFGHGLYEHQVDPALERTPLARGTSLGMHESQSRMWENLVGRSRPFWHHFFPRLQETFPDALAGYDADRWYREVNAVEPSLIRVDSDEATYNLHIILRFELEQELLAGAVSLEQLPDEWNRRMWEYLRVEVPDDAHGVLQDVHWAGGAIGYFPTYALGNLISAQIWDRLRADIPTLDDEIAAGEFESLRDWLRTHMHRFGRKVSPPELLERVAGTPTIDPAPYVRYLRGKLSGIYGIAPEAS